MAPGAAEGHAQEGPAHGVDLFIDEFHAKAFLILKFVIHGAEDEVSAADQLLVASFGRFVGEEVSGEMFADELVEGFVFVEGFDDVVPEAPGVREDHAASAAAGLGKAGHVEPMPSPSFAKVGTGEEVIDDLFERLR